MQDHRWLSRARVVAFFTALLMLASVAVAVGRQLGGPAAPAIITASAVPTVMLPPSTTTTVPPTTTTLAPTTTVAPRPAAPATTTPRVRALARAAPVLAGSIDAFRGLGTWVDVFDWSNEYTNNKPTVGVAAVDKMADLGVQTLYIQAARQESQNDIVDPNLLIPMINRAHARNMAVVAWYLPTLEDVGRDLTRLLAISRLNVEGIGVDIESRKVGDAAERSRRLVDISAALREQLPGRAIAAIVMPPVATDVINPSFWPGFPWHELRPLYDLWMPMDYWTLRNRDSEYRDAYRYTAENIDRLRADLGVPSAVVHPIGGIGDTTTDADADGYERASLERGAIGGGLYDYRTTADSLYPGLRRFRVS
jgi:hypothetical protein